MERWAYYNDIPWKEFSSLFRNFFFLFLHIAKSVSSVTIRQREKIKYPGKFYFRSTGPLLPFYCPFPCVGWYWRILSIIGLLLPWDQDWLVIGVWRLRQRARNTLSRLEHLIASSYIHHIRYSRHQRITTSDIHQSRESLDQTGLLKHYLALNTW